jgi:hypothetical protein
MKRYLALAFSIIAVGVCVMSASSQPPQGKEKGFLGKKGGPGPFEMGRVLPPHVRSELNLTADQEKQIAELEKEVKQKLSKILTADQIKKAETIRPPFAPPAKEGKGKDGLPAKEKDQARATGGGIQWFSTWDAGIAEAERTGRPILLVSAAPHCAGVSGIW